MKLLTPARLTAQLAMVLLLPTMLAAQDTTPPTATAVPALAIMPASAADTIERILTARSVDTVRTEKDRLLGERRDAETQWAAFRDQGEKL
jgi:hypothetical protein